MELSLILSHNRPVILRNFFQPTVITLKALNRYFNQIDSFFRQFIFQI